MKAYHKFISGLLTACMTLTSFPAIWVNAEDTPDAVEWNGHQYAVIQKELNPIEASQYCQSLGGYLATITSADEQAFVAYLASQVDWEDFWIGGSDDGSEGEWYWLNGETWDYTAWYLGGAVGKTEPNNGYGAGENYVFMNRSRDYQWVDVFGGYDNYSTKTYFICEWGDHEGTTKSTWNGHTYQYFDTGMTWDDAKAYCESLGGHLATVTSEEEESVIEALVENGTRDVYWLGGKTTNLVFTWITGENTSYTHWSSGQPDNWGKGDCIEYQRINAGGVSGHGWGDTDNAGEYFGLEDTGFICEWDDVPSNTVVWNQHIYQFFDTGITWDKAKEYCQTIGGHLATITSAEEQAQIEKLIANGTKNNYWLGGNIENYQLSWITGEPVDYTNWASGQPDNYQNDDCLEILRVQDASLMPYHWCDTNRNAVVDNFDSAFFGVENFGFVVEWDDISQWNDTSLKVSLSVEDTVVRPAENMDIHVNIYGIIPDDAWISFVPSDIPHTEKDGDDNNGDWMYLKNIQDDIATLTTPNARGNYDIRVYDGDDAETAKEIAYLTITLCNAPDLKVTLSTDSTAVKPAENMNIYVDISGTVPDDAWITFVPSDVPHTEKDGDDNNGNWMYLKDIQNNTAVLKTPSSVGKYDIRVYNGDDSRTADEIAYLPITVTENTGIPEVTLMGDANNDGEFSLVDIVLLQKWLLHKSGAYLGNWKNVDFNQDGRINIFDFCLMKHELLTVPEPEVLATNFNIYTVQNTPSTESTFTVDKTCKIYSLMTYHWNYGNGTQETGTITLLEDGKTLGTWSTSGTEGMYSTPNACWWAYPENLVLTSGHIYTIVDSDPATWSQNGGSDYAGFFEVQGSYIGAVG